MRRKLIVIFLSFGVGLVLYGISQNVDFVLFHRLVATAQEGHLSNRDKIIESLWPYCMQHIFWGVGQTGYVEVSKEALGKVSNIGGIIYGASPHNVLVEIVLYTGLWGLLLYIVFWCRVLVSSFKSFRVTSDILPILLIIPIVGCILSGQILTEKWVYICYAYMISLSLNRKCAMSNALR